MKISQIIKSTFGLTLILAVVFSTLNISFDMHFCNGELKNASFFGEAESCQHRKSIASHCTDTSSSCHASMQVKEEKEPSCCQNETLEIESLDSDFLHQSVEKISFSKPFLATIFSFSTVFQKTTPSSNALLSRLFKPPSIDYDYQAIHQVYII